MSNFKSGSGNLDFGGSDGDESDGQPSDESADKDGQKVDETKEPERSQSVSPETASSDTEGSSDKADPAHVSAERSETAANSTADYPYFVRRNNVGDERDTRLEIHVRDKVADQEATFRNEVAEHLETDEISKTDAREFALIAAFHHPERVAELMQEEGFGTLD